jgi:flagellar motility protein MotE (MotC chaperone)
VLAVLGAEGAAEKLMGMDARARASIIESMAPRDAAGTLVSMEDALQVCCRHDLMRIGGLIIAT